MPLPPDVGKAAACVCCGGTGSNPAALLQSHPSTRHITSPRRKFTTRNATRQALTFCKYLLRGWPARRRRRRRYPSASAATTGPPRGVTGTEGGVRQRQSNGRGRNTRLERQRGCCVALVQSLPRLLCDSDVVELALVVVGGNPLHARTHGARTRSHLRAAVVVPGLAMLSPPQARKNSIRELFN